MFRGRLVVVSALLLAGIVTAGCGSSGNLETEAGQMRFGVQAARMDLWREAQFRFQRAVEINPQDAMAYNNLAVAYEGMGEYDKAREAYLSALKLDRSNQYIQKNYSRFVEFYQRSEKKDEGKDAADEGDDKPGEKKDSSKKDSGGNA